MRTRIARPLTAAALAVGLSLGLAACDDTADGVQQDTEDNLGEIDEELDEADNSE